ncbi:MAG: M67 family metallopeptidase [Acidobacteria bacterium]|nr:M67 family metallopeptidase [Acidobacteriota bacterium]
MLRLSSHQLQEICEIAERAYPHECCGILVGSRQDPAKVVERLVPAENQRKDSLANRYLIAPEFTRSIEKKLAGSGLEILGFFHSHPDVPARPSEFDRDHAWPWYSYLIVSVQKRKASETYCWQLKEDRSAFESEQMEVV